ncbi:MAG: CDP-alcohol phosphatidyltransferase family protein [Proteobacteria bacterium]|jgi:archaetidylinositol phosphate synthase|nr:CDP-alcohol phosphatidyltransferase family protein [Pseudomonadota bacterium]
MLDSHGHKYLQPLLDFIARHCARHGISANSLTLAGLACGLAAALAIALGAPLTGVALLWLSGLLDAADGTLARMTAPTALGAVMDITFDRVVEVAVIIALALRHPDARLTLVVLTAVIVVAMSLFLSMGAAMANRSAKSFHYAPGLAERTEGFVFLSAMTLDSAHLVAWSLLFCGAIVFTMGQRYRDLRAALTERASSSS